MPEVVPVRQSISLPPASFRIHLAVNKPAPGYVPGTINLHSGLPHVRLRPCRAHPKKQPTLLLGRWAVNISLFNSCPVQCFQLSAT